MAYNIAPSKQDLLLSGTNLKSINGVSLLGSGDANAIHDAGSNPETIDFATGATQNLIVNGAGPLVLSFSNPTSGGFYFLRIEQGATPGSITWPGSVNWGTVGAPTLSDTTGDVDLISLFYDGSKYWGVAQIQDALPAANNALTNLSLSGTNGQVLTLQSGVPAWAAAAGGASFPLLGSLGAANAPTYSFSGDDDTGMWTSGNNTVNFSATSFEIRSNSTSSPNSGFGFNAYGQTLFTTYGAGGHLRLQVDPYPGLSGGAIFLGGSGRGDSLRNAIYFSNSTDAIRMFITEAGNVGIGTTAPTSNFEVFGADAEILVHFNNASRGGLRALSGQRIGLITTTASDNLVFGYEDGVKGTFHEKMRITNQTGNVNIHAQLEVNGNSYINGAVQVPNYTLSPKHFNAGTKTANFTLDLANGPCQEVTLNSSSTLNIALTNPVVGGSYTIKVIQGATPAGLLWPSNVKWAGAAPVHTKIIDRIDIVKLYYDGINYFGTYSLGYSLLNDPPIISGATVFWNPNNPGSLAGSSLYVNDVSGVGTPANLTFLTPVSLDATQTAPGVGAFLVDGGNYGSVTNSKFAVGTGAFTLSMWVKITNFAEQTNLLFSFDGTNGPSGALICDTRPFMPGTQYFHGGQRISDGNTNFGTDWFNVTFVGNGGLNGARTLKLYRNGTQIGSTYTYDYNMNSDNRFLGANHSGAAAESFHGYYGQVVFYDKELSPAEVLNNFDVAKAQYLLV